MKELSVSMQKKVNGGSDGSKGTGFILGYKLTRAAQELFWHYFQL